MLPFNAYITTLREVIKLKYLNKLFGCDVKVYTTHEVGYSHQLLLNLNHLKSLF